MPAGAIIGDDSPATKPDLQVIKLADFEKVVAGHAGKPVAVDLWATYCVPCKVKFPKFLKFAKEHQQQAVFLSLSIDEETETAKAKEFLAEFKSPIPNYRLADDVTKMETKYEFEGVPTYLVFDAKGKKVFVGSDLEKAEKKVLELIEAK